MYIRIAIFVIAALFMIQPAFNSDSPKRSQHEFPIDQNMNKFIQESNFHI